MNVRKSSILPHKLNHEFLKTMRQELGKHINRITNSLEVLKTSYDNLDEHQKLLNIKRIGIDSEKVNYLITNIIDLCKLDSDYKLFTKSFDFSNLLNERIEYCKKIYIEEQDDKLWDFRLNIEKNVVIWCDKYYMERVLDNIIANAIEYSIDKQITINLKKLNSKAELSVSNQNLSITKKYLPNIFDHSILNISKNKILAIRLLFCQKIIEAHGGQIWSRAVHQQGVTFAFSIPLNL